MFVSSPINVAECDTTLKRALTIGTSASLEGIDLFTAFTFFWGDGVQVIFFIMLTRLYNVRLRSGRLWFDSRLGHAKTLKMTFTGFLLNSQRERIVQRSIRRLYLFVR